MSECIYFSQCGFVQKYGSRKSLCWRGMVSQYCQGEARASCQRRPVGTKGTISDTELMPSGKKVPLIFLDFN